MRWPSEPKSMSNQPKLLPQSADKIDSFSDVEIPPIQSSPSQRQHAIPISDIGKYLDNLTASKDIALIQNKHYCGLRSEMFVFACSRGKCRGNIRNIADTDYCPYHIKMVLYYNDQDKYIVQECEKHNHPLQDDNMSKSLHRQVKEWINACLRLGMDDTSIFMASLDQRYIANIGRIPAYNGDSQKSTVWSSSWHPTIKQIVKIHRKFKQCSKNSLKMTIGNSRILEKHLDKILYCSTFMDTDSINYFFSVANICSAKLNKDLSPLTIIPKDLYLYVLQTESMRDRMMNLQEKAKENVVLHYYTTRKSFTQGCILGIFLYKNNSELGEIIAYVILSHKIIELLCIAILKLVGAGLKPNLAVTNKSTTIICALKCIFGPSFPVYIQHWSILDKWTKWLDSPKIHSFKKIAKHRANSSFILERMKALAIANTTETFTAEMQRLFQYCMDNDLSYIIDHYSRRYGLSIEQAINECSSKRRIPAYSCCEDFWSLIYHTKNIDLLLLETEDNMEKLHFEELFYNMKTRKMKNIYDFINQIIHFMIQKVSCTDNIPPDGRNG